MKKSFPLLFILSFVLTNTFSQIQLEQLQNYLSPLRSRSLAFGSLAIYQDQKPVYLGFLGYAITNGDKKIFTHPNTRYRIGSVSKMFTAVMVFQLIEKNKLSLDQHLSTYFPDLPNADKITIGHLLNHQSGLHDYTKDTGFEEWMDKPKTQAALLQIIRDKGVDFEPGTRNDYCNTNYLLLSYILEKITGLSYEANLQKRITTKLGLKNTYLAKIGEPSITESVSYKYSNASWNAVKQTDPSIHSGAGAIISTPFDLSVFIQKLFTGKLIRQSSLEKMKTITNDYGMGLFSYDHGTSKGYGHNGRIEEFYTAVRYYPESKISVVYCTNGINYPRTDILDGVIKSCFNEPVAIPFSSTTSSQLDKVQGIYEASQMPVVTISVQDSKLIAETQGARFELEPVSENYFMHAPTGYYFEFVPAENALRIKETDNVYFLKKK